VYSKLKEVQKLDILGSTMFVEYIDFTETCEAEDIEIIEWISVLFIGRRGHIGFAPVLLIKTRSGKKFQIPPAKGFDIQKSLSEWLNKHKKMPESNAALNE
jgi:hypothetical protein